jgi:hypothetical protein
VPARRGAWADLSPRTRDRWVGRFGGRGSPAMQERRGRAAYELGATISRAEAGHERADARERTTISLLVDDPPRFVELAGLSRAERRRVARYDALASNLVQGRLSPAAFRARVSGWRRIAGFRFLADPDAVVAILDDRRQSGEETFVYRGRRQ